MYGDYKLAYVDFENGELKLAHHLIVVKNKRWNFESLFKVTLLTTMKDFFVDLGVCLNGKARGRDDKWKSDGDNVVVVKLLCEHFFLWSCKLNGFPWYGVHELHVMNPI
jgi:hypothetical protein